MTDPYDLYDFSHIPLIHLARAVCISAHAGQVDKAGDPYWRHPDAVARSIFGQVALPQPGRTIATAIAYLHDVLEDTAVTANHLHAIGFPSLVVFDVELLTHEKGVPRALYIERIGTSERAIIVKMADLAHNLDPTRRWTPGTKQRQQYEADQRYLQRVLRETEGNE